MGGSRQHEFGFVRCHVNAKNIYGATPLHYAFKRQHIDTVKILIRFEADEHAKGYFGLTPQHWALNDDIEKVKAFEERPRLGTECRHCIRIC